MRNWFLKIIEEFMVIEKTVLNTSDSTCIWIAGEMLAEASEIT
jgi:hypothetical protein